MTANPQPPRRYTVELLPLHAPCGCMRENWRVLGSRATKRAAIALAERLYRQGGLETRQVIDNKTNEIVWSRF